MDDDIRILDTQVQAWQLDVGDGIVIDQEFVEVLDFVETDDADEVLVIGYSHSTGEKDTYPLVWDDLFSLWRTE
jgi:hypothetical protein